MIPHAWKKRVNQAAQVISEAADLLIQVRNKPGVVECVAAGARMFNTLHEISEDSKDVHEFFRMGWEAIPDSGLDWEIIQQAMKSGVAEKVGEPRDQNYPLVGRFSGIEIGWKWYAAGSDFQGPYCREGLWVGRVGEYLKVTSCLLG